MGHPKRYAPLFRRKRYSRALMDRSYILGRPPTALPSRSLHSARPVQTTPTTSVCTTPISLACKQNDDPSCRKLFVLREGRCAAVFCATPSAFKGKRACESPGTLCPLLEQGFIHFSRPCDDKTSPPLPCHGFASRRGGRFL